MLCVCVGVSIPDERDDAAQWRGTGKPAQGTVAGVGKGRGAGSMRPLTMAKDGCVDERKTGDQDLQD
jgi:hypothetical protein